MQNLIIRQETSGDHTAIFKVNEAAFGRRDEARLVDTLRANGDISFSFVASSDRGVVGHLLFSPVTVASNPEDCCVLGLGPVAVLPEEQGRGVGTALIQKGLTACRSAGVDAVVVLGHSAYYSRFGFEAASKHKLRFRGEDVGDSFRVLELSPGSLSSLSGAVHYASAFG